MQRTDHMDISKIDLYKQAHLNKSYLSISAINVLLALEEEGYEAWIVGGWVRDALIGASSHDIDMCCSATWQQSKNILKKAGIKVEETGTKFGGITAIINQERIEVTQYRIDGFYTDGRHPKDITCASCIEDDISRRDFTVNAMAWHPLRGLLDLHEGKKDIDNKLIRCVGNPTRRFQEDGLRMLRAIRFAARLNFQLETKTKQSLTECAPLLSKIANERIGSELNEMFKTCHSATLIQENPDLISTAIPEMAETIGFNQHTPYHCFDVYEHSAHVVGHIEALLTDNKTTRNDQDTSLIWAALLHDVGKPQCYSIDTNHRGHFYGHPHISAQIAAQVFVRLGINKTIAKRALVLIEHHDEKLNPCRKEILRYMNHLVSDKNYQNNQRNQNDSEIFDQIIDLRIADTLSKSRECHAYTSTLEKIRCAMHKYVTSNEAYSIATLDLSGKDLIERGVEPGPIIKSYLNQALQLCIEGKVRNNRNDLLTYLKL